MSEEVLIPKMMRIDKKRKNFKIPFLNIALVLLFTLFLISSTFICLKLRHFVIPQGFFSGGKNFVKDDFLFSFAIIPQIPALLFTCSSLGKKLATTCVSLYFLAGITLFPFFAFGGGLNYITEYSFGYILAFIPAVLISGHILRKKYSLLNMLLATLCTVVLIHFSGIIYMVLVALIKQDGREFIFGWIKAQSGLKIIYDFVLGLLCVFAGEYVNKFLKFITE